MLGIAALVFMVSYSSTRYLSSPTSKVAVLDLPNDRSLHLCPTPRSGGLAILGGLLLGLLVERCMAWFSASVTVGEHNGPVHASILISGIALVIGTLSFWDDVVGLRSSVRLGIHTFVAIAICWGYALIVYEIPVPFFGTIQLSWMALPFSVLFVIWMANLYNFMDGMDGFAAGMTVVGHVFLGYLAWKGGQPSLAAISLFIAASAAGFLVYNIPPAKIFMGDVGSVSLGFLTGVIALLGIRAGLFDVWVPLLIFSPFIADATLTLLRRLLRVEKVWEAHREHYYQRLVLSGWSHRKTVWVEYALMLLSGVSAIVYTHAGQLWRLLILIGWLATYLSLALAVHSIERQGDSVRAEA